MQSVKGPRTSGVGVGEELGEGELDPESEGEMPKSVDGCNDTVGCLWLSVPYRPNDMVVVRFSYR